MKIYQKIKYTEISIKLKNILEFERKLRGFNLKKHLIKKAKILNKYMNDCSLNTCVVALSGGLDSSVTLGIVNYASKLKNSPIKKIFPIAIPCNTDGATNQTEAYEKAKKITDILNLNLEKIEIANSVQNFTNTIEKELNLKSDQWSRGQAVAYYRTASLYFTTSLLTANNYKSIVIGTTNRDEGAYIGYFGKASDGMVDVQLISDFHKNDLKKIAEYFNFPSNIIKDAPTGDMYDGRIDEDVFGVTYDYIELYTYYLQKNKKEKEKFIKKLKEENVFEEFNLMSVNVENMHKYNGHKYLGSSPSIHLDVINSLFDGGWKYNVYSKKEKECYVPEFGDHKSW